ncbi:hypothetical protein [Flexithrix dorotheae]|uniref:hypothetical protein n=1 Tax=Flexithrix dorotheae TaxID=70993 RepID=UPI00035F74F5|nr:hypothetical protein [Flexithrix dorotheae]
MRIPLTIISCSLFFHALSANGQMKKNQSLDKKKATYLNARKALEQQDSLMAFDASIVLTQEEQNAEEKLGRLRNKMLKDYRENHYFPPASYFYRWEKHMEESQLFDLLKKMPKGGIHHLHPVTMQDYDWIVERAAREENCYVYWEVDNNSFVKGQLGFFKHGQQPTGFYPTKELATKNPQFKTELLDLLTFDNSISNDSTDIWMEFEKTFQRTGKFYKYQPIFKEYFRVAIKNMIKDGLQHLELREGLSFTLYDLEHPEGYYTPDTTIQYWKDLENEFKQEIPEFSIKIIHTFLRFFEKEKVWQDMELAFQLRKKYPEMIKGYDLVAEEDAGNTSIYFLDNWLKMDSLQMVYGVDLPLYLHDGESNWISNDNLYDAVLLNSKRIGHGFNLFRYPALIQKVKENNICVEVNPLSNQILGYISDLRMHPATYFMNQGVQISISPDDPGVFSYTGVTPDYWAIYLAWELDFQALKKLVWNSIIYSSLNEKEKEMSLKALEKKWAEWIDYVNSELN